MYSVGFQAIQNLKLPEEKNQAPVGDGLLSRRNNMSQTEQPKEPKDRVAQYVSQIRKARMELKNG